MHLGLEVRDRGSQKFILGEELDMKDSLHYQLNDRGGQTAKNVMSRSRDQPLINSK